MVLFFVLLVGSWLNRRFFWSIAFALVIAIWADVNELVNISDGILGKYLSSVEFWQESGYEWGWTKQATGFAIDKIEKVDSWKNVTT